MMQRVTIKAYAVKHKLSIFNVMKMAKSGKLKTDIVEEDGKEVTYILLDGDIEKKIQEGIIPIKKRDESSVKEMIRVLQDEVKWLRKELDALKKRL
jgi:hypothetical protein